MRRLAAAARAADRRADPRAGAQFRGPRAELDAACRVRSPRRRPARAALSGSASTAAPRSVERAAGSLADPDGAHVQPTGRSSSDGDRVSQSDRLRAGGPERSHSRSSSTSSRLASSSMSPPGRGPATIDVPGASALSGLRRQALLSARQTADVRWTLTVVGARHRLPREPGRTCSIASRSEPGAPPQRRRRAPFAPPRRTQRRRDSRS